MVILNENEPSGKLNKWYIADCNLQGTIHISELRDSIIYWQCKNQKWWIWYDCSWQHKCNISLINYITGLEPFGCCHGNIMKSFYSQWLLHTLFFFFQPVEMGHNFLFSLAILPRFPFHINISPACEPYT